VYEALSCNTLPLRLRHMSIYIIHDKKIVMCYMYHDRIYTRVVIIEARARSRRNTLPLRLRHMALLQRTPEPPLYGRYCAVCVCACVGDLWCVLLCVCVPYGAAATVVKGRAPPYGRPRPLGGSLGAYPSYGAERM
jgi:hypothetical protein